MNVSLSEEILAVRHSVTLSSLDHVRYVRLSGHGAYDAVDRIFTRELYVRDGQLSQGLLLNEDGTIFADCYLGADDEDFFFLLEGPGEELLAAYLARHLDGVADVDIADETGAHVIVALDGPYAWELMARLVGPEVIGLPYLTFFRVDGALCYRAGKTGEYGYRLIVPRDELEGRWEQLCDLGAQLDLREVELEALDQCALENWFLNVRLEGGRPVTPIELQLQWRISYHKTYVGSEALGRRRAEGVSQRLTCVVSPQQIAIDDAVSYGNEDLGEVVIGEVVNAGFSPVREEWVGLALLDVAYAYPDIDPLVIGDQRVEGRTVSPPVLNNRSLYVNPQLQSYATRLEDDFPPV